jgi:hypothetical protein
MPSLGEFLGAIMADVTNARRIADEEALRVAEHYKQEPLLRGLSMPRLRMPEVVIELPVVIEEHEPADPGEPADPAEVSDLASRYLAELAKEENVSLSRAFIDDFTKSLNAEPRSISEERPGVPRVAMRQPYANAGELALLRVTKSRRSPLTPEILNRITPKLRERIASAAVKRPAKPSTIQLRVRTEEVKTASDPQTVTRLRLNLREEGLEWSEFTREDGETATRLTPE